MKMMQKDYAFSMFTKPWKDKTAEGLAELVKSLGYDGVEFPLRDGYQVEPANAEKGLTQLAELFAKYDLKIYSVASQTTENVFAGCAAAGIPLIRIMFGNNLSKNYMEAEAEMRRTIEGFLPLCEKYGVKVGVQHHYGPGINNSMEMRHLLEPYDSNLIGGIWDAAHSGLAGEEPEQALDIIWDHLAIINFKNAYYVRTNGPEAAAAKFDYYFTTGPNGLCSWERAVKHMMKKGYKGNICLPAEYHDEAHVEKYAAQDLVYLKELMGV